jgi:hypothetical protein
MKSLIFLMLVVVLLLAGAQAAFAGEWSVVVVDNLPSNPMVGETVVVDFRVLAHGHNPVDGLEPNLVFFNRESRKRLNAPAAPTGQPGRYSASFSIPAAGTWVWSIVVYEGPHIMPVIQVSESRDTIPVESAATPVRLWEAAALCLAGLKFALDCRPAIPVGLWGDEQRSAVGNGLLRYKLCTCGLLSLARAGD